MLAGKAQGDVGRLGGGQPCRRLVAVTLAGDVEQIDEGVVAAVGTARWVDAERGQQSGDAGVELGRVPVMYAVPDGSRWARANRAICTWSGVASPAMLWRATSRLSATSRLTNGSVPTSELIDE